MLLCAPHNHDMHDLFIICDVFHHKQSYPPVNLLIKSLKVWNSNCMHLSACPFLLKRDKETSYCHIFTLKENIALSFCFQDKCFHYWPEVGTGCYGSMQVTLTESSFLPVYSMRTFSLINEQVGGSSIYQCLLNSERR